MSDLLRLFSDASDAIEAGITSEMTPAGALFKRDGQPFSEALIRIDQAYEVDPSKYCSLICYTGHKGERQVAGVRSRGGDEPRLGYIFPISSLRAGQFIEGEWALKFAWAASHKLLSGIGGELATRFPTVSVLEGSPAITDLFFDHLSICVVGRQNLEKAGIELNQLPLMLMREGVRIPTAPSQFTDGAALRDWAANVNVSSPSADVLDDIEELTMMLAAADAYKSPAGEFLTFYQAIEYVIEKIFSAAVSATVSGELTPWVLKERLSKVATEKWRLSIMASKCLASAQNSKFGDVKRACHVLLTAAGEKDIDDCQWWELLYSVRNIIVHGQMRIIRNGHENLQPVIASLREACLEVLLSFRVPELQDIWETRIPEAVVPQDMEIAR